MPRRVWGVRASGVLVLALLAPACSGTPEVDVPEPTTPAARDACEDLLADLPDRLAGEDATDVAAVVEPDDAPAVAWGDPAIVVSCGGPMPSDFSNVSPCEAIEGVDWYVDEATRGDQAADVEATTVARDPIVRLTLPADYRPEGYLDATAELAAPIMEHTELVGERCV